MIAQNRRKVTVSLGGFIDRVSWTGNLIAGILMLLVSLSICYETSMRYFFDLPTEWVMSLSLLAFMWFPFLSAAYGIKENKHICCDVFVSRAAPRTRELLGVATDLTPQTVRRFGLDSAFVDYKICAVDKTWSGLCFARRKSE